jgi:hypothetical protein
MISTACNRSATSDVCTLQHYGIRRAPGLADMGSRLAFWVGLPYVLVLPSGIQADDLTLPAQYEGKAVAAVRFDPAIQPVKPAELSRLVGVSQGSPLHLASIRAAIKRLYGTGEYSSIEVDTEPSGAGLTLIFRTTGQWFVGPVEVKERLRIRPTPVNLSMHRGLTWARRSVTLTWTPRLRR